MPKDYHQQPRTAMRRSDRAITDEAWIEAFLTYAPVGVLATTHDNQPFINSNLFVYDQDRHAIYIHTAKVGRTRANIEHNPQVCFSIMSMGRLLPADVALEFSVEY
ncbi:MAG: pyridoxamine 5'-phosphate oxidase family protein, partial [Chloroflexi bacterium]